jgi:hypothetical protein
MTLTFQLECVLDSCDCVEDVGEGHWIGNPQQELYWVVVVEKWNNYCINASINDWINDEDIEECVREDN